MKKLLLLATLAVGLLALYGPPVHAASDLSESVHVVAGANAAWLDGPAAAFPADFEAGGTVWSSLSPHISLFGDAYYGFSHSYVRWDGGAKVTATDVDNPNFSVYLSFKYRGGSVSALHPNEAAYGAGFGWVPAPDSWPNVIVVGDASMGAQTSRTIGYLGVRYLIPLK